LLDQLITSENNQYLLLPINLSKDVGKIVFFFLFSVKKTKVVTVQFIFPMGNEEVKQGGPKNIISRQNFNNILTTLTHTYVTTF